MFRVFGPGLGNLLFPWARFVVLTRKYGMKPIWPTWPQVKIGTIYRREMDKRLYNILFKCPKNYIKGWKKLFLLLFQSHVAESAFEKCVSSSDGGWKGKVIIFSGMNDYFSKIKEDYKTVKKELLKITLTKHKIGLNYDFKNSISVHVRLGDFRKSLLREREQASINVRLPLQWYVQIIDQLRSSLGRPIPVYIFSDGRNSELREILDLENTKRLSFGSAIADLLGMSQSSILVASGSTFSMWATYLGRMPVIWYRGQLRQRLYMEEHEAEVECALNENLPPYFLSLTRKRIFIE
jgi:hypothetical protein